jgi:Lecithin:cholesterol acyltransferase
VRALLVVPGLFGTEIHDVDVGCLWGTLRCLYRGAPIGTLAGLRGRPGRVLRGISVLPGLDYDIIGSLLRELGRAGYRADQDLYLHAYDWRLRALELGAALAEEVRRLASRTGGPVDLLGLSNGGMLIRAAFAVDRELPVERVVTSGTPHAGAVETLACLHGGFKFAPFGRTVSPEEFISCPGSLDAIPTPGSPTFPDGDPDGGAGERYDLYDLATWQRLRMAVFRRHPGDPAWSAVVADRLRCTSETWRALDAAAAPRHLTCVVGAGLPTQVRVVVRDGRAVIPGEGKVAGLPAWALTEGDGALTVESSAAWTGARPHVIRVPVTRHRDTVRTKAAWQAILEGLS